MGLQPVREPAVPGLPDDRWSRNEIDRFILHRLRSEGLKPSAPAERQALIRRVYFDLIGLPPTPAEVDAFLADRSANAHERLVDRLLASPRYGERWARHWLDLVRYAESDGFRIDEYRPNAWRYRDYVIRSFNADKPYDRFVLEQLAGDEIAPDDPEARTATGFLRHTIYEYNQRDVRTQWADMLNDLTDTTGDVFLGLGMGCARCHDHKFDPILQKDYYRLQAFFAPFLPRDDVPLATRREQAEYRDRLAKWEAKTAEIRKQIEAIEQPRRKTAARGAIEKFPDDIHEMLLKDRARRTPLEQQLAELAYRQVLYEFDRIETKMKDEEKQKLAALKRQLAEFDREKPAPLPAGLTVTDVGPTAPPTLLPKKGQGTVEPGFLSVLDDKPAAIAPVPTAPESTGRRTALARWLVRPDNPLTSRVIVNRIWQYHFGRGLAAAASDFGRLGEKPSHPELLDFLANRFVKDGWSFKKMHRLILTSATYQQSALLPASREALTRDPENRLLWRGTTRRLDAEQIRDSILAVTGELDLQAGGPSVDAVTPRRTIYTRVTRNTRNSLLDVFDAPEGFVSTAQRNVTTTASQALLLLNSQSFLQRARAMALRLGKEGRSATDEELVASAYRLAYGRAPTPEERTAAVRFLREQARRINPREIVGPGFYSEKMPYREGKAALLQPTGPQVRMQTPDSPDFPTGDFTIEAFVLLRSVYEGGTVRTIASHWGGDRKRPGWSFGVTSKKSAFKPQTLVLQLWGGKDGKEYEAVFSGLHIALNKPYFVATAVNLGSTDKTGITFWAKDLSNDDEPVQVAHAAHKLTALGKPGAAFTIGGHDNQPQATWDGLIDDVRLSNVALPQELLLLTRESVADSTVGFWQFEARPDPYHDFSGHGHALRAQSPRTRGDSDPRTAALIDFCHALLNSNEFLYVD